MVQATRKCSINGCNEGRYARGVCSRHYQQKRRQGEFEPRPKPKPKTCKVEDCADLAWARELCGTHYQQWRRESKPARKRPFQKRHMTPDESFQARTEWRGECLIWTGYTQPDGYGQMRINGKGKRAHRYAWERIHGEIPENMVIDHACQNRSCVNVEHLRLATVSQNNMHRRGPDSDGSSGHRNVYRHGNRWNVKLEKHGDNYHVGMFEKKEDAIKAAEEARRRLFGEFAGRG